MFHVIKFVTVCELTSGITLFCMCQTVVERTNSCCFFSVFVSVFSVISYIPSVMCEMRLFMMLRVRRIKK